MRRRLSPFALAFAASSMLAASGACNAINGADDVKFGCPDCDPGRPLTDGASDVDGGVRPPGLDGSLDGAELSGPGGILDKSFGTDGIVVSDLLDAVTSVAVRGDGKIVVAGAFGGHLAVARFDASGMPDTTFGGTGRVVVPTLTTSRADAVSIDPKGRIIAAGLATSYDGTTGVTTQYGYVARIGDNGPDLSFGPKGTRTFTTNGEAISAVVSPASDDFYMGGSAPGGGGTEGVIWHMADNGALLPPRVVLAYVTGPSATVTAMVVASTSIIVAGGSTSTAGDVDFGVARLVANGFDGTFDGDGKATVAATGGDNSATALGRFSDGSIVVGGESAAVLPLIARTPQFGLVKLGANGSTNAAWGSGGKATASFEQPGQLFSQAGDYLRGLVVDANDRVIAVGYADEKSAGPHKYRAIVTRLAANGQPDNLFGALGELTFLFEATAQTSRPSAVALQPDKKIIVVGTAANRLGIARITP